MLKVAVAKLTTDDGEKLFLQRRKATTPLFPRGLSFFGGQLEPHESPEECVSRELREETRELGDIALKHVSSMTVLPPATESEEPVEVHVFEGKVDGDLGFTATEGAAVELFTKEEALDQPDLVPTTRYVLEKL